MKKNDWRMKPSGDKKTDWTVLVTGRVMKVQKVDFNDGDGGDGKTALGVTAMVMVMEVLNNKTEKLLW
jgi:hypothetical protein